MLCLKRISRTERSGRYGSEHYRDDPDWRDRRDRDQDRDHSSRRWSEERRDRYDGDRRGPRDSPEVTVQIFTIFEFILLSDINLYCVFVVVF